MDNELLSESRKYSEKLGISLNQLVRNLLEKEVRRKESNWIQELEALGNQVKLPKRKNSLKWRRDEIYRV